MMNANTNNPNIPDIAIQIVHIEGPRKGEIDEFKLSKITIGRDPDSDIVFPNEANMVSRKHAEIKREGNRFLLLSRGQNGCYVNGELANEVYLKQGDVITFAEGGPKVSFLYSVQPVSQSPSALVSRPRPTKTSEKNIYPPKGQKPVVSQAAAFTLQYGTNIKSFKQNAVTLGKSSTSNFLISHPRVYDLHAELYFQNDQYYIRDLTEAQAILLNGRPLKSDTQLQQNDIVMLGEGGPQLRYLGAGRMAEVLLPSGSEQAPSKNSSNTNSSERSHIDKEGIKGLIDSFRKR